MNKKEKVLEPNINQSMAGGDSSKEIKYDWDESVQKYVNTLDSYKDIKEDEKPK